MDRQTAIVLRIVFSLMIVAGAIAGFASFSAGGVHCGAVFYGPSAVDQSFDDVEAALAGNRTADYAACNSKKSTQGTIVWSLLAVGGIGSIVTRSIRKRSEYEEWAVSAYGSDDPEVIATEGDDLQTLPAGWYPDPNDDRWLAYWDGEKWDETDEKYPNR